MSVMHEETIVAYGAFGRDLSQEGAVARYGNNILLVSDSFLTRNAQYPVSTLIERYTSTFEWLNQRFNRGAS